jgi:hypothetical protein
LSQDINQPHGWSDASNAGATWCSHVITGAWAQHDVALPVTSSLPARRWSPSSDLLINFRESMMVTRQLSDVGVHGIHGTCPCRAISP